MEYFLNVFNLLADLFDWVTKAGTLPMQGLMLLGLILLGLVIRYLHYEHRKVLTDFIQRMDAKDASMTKERLDRINMLMGLIEKNVETNARVANAVENNTKAMADLKTFMREQAEITEKQIELMQKAIRK